MVSSSSISLSLFPALSKALSFLSPSPSPLSFFPKMYRTEESERRRRVGRPETRLPGSAFFSSRVLRCCSLAPSPSRAKSTHTVALKAKALRSRERERERERERASKRTDRGNLTTYNKIDSFSGRGDLSKRRQRTRRPSPDSAPCMSGTASRSAAARIGREAMRNME